MSPKAQLVVGIIVAVIGAALLATSAIHLHSAGVLADEMSVADIPDGEMRLANHRLVGWWCLAAAVLAAVIATVLIVLSRDRRGGTAVRSGLG